MARGEKLEPRLLFATFTVLNTSDSGVGSLRQVLADAGASPGADVVHFAVPGAGVHTIHPLTPLVVGNDLSVDGTTQPGFAGTPMVELSGDLLPTSDHFYDRVAFDIQGSRTAISGLAITRCASAGIYVEGNDVQLKGNFIGTDPTGTAASANNYGIIARTDTSGLTIGGTVAAARNVISGNNVGVVTPTGSVENTLIQGNYIGTDRTGTSAIPNGTGLRLGGAGPTTVGGTDPGARNIISGNTDVGVSWGYFDLAGRVLLGNYIGLSATGTRLGNGIGVDLVQIHNLEIGGVTPAARNVISANTTGIRISGIAPPTDNVIHGNYIGTDPTGMIPMGNLTGISMQDGERNIIGGTTAADRNVIAGNTQLQVGVSIGVFSSNSTNLIQGNYIGLNAAGTAGLGGQSNATGVMLAAASSTLGGTVPGAGNVIGGTHTSVSVFGAGARVEGNFVGTNASGTAAAGSSTFGISVTGSDVVIGGSIAAARNVVSGSGTGIILNSGSATQRVSIQGNYIGTDVTGTAAIPNGTGIFMSASNCEVGGIVPGAGNVIAGNSGIGIDVRWSVFSDALNNRICGNTIGVGADGTTSLGNKMGGILIEGASNTVIGGAAASEANVIANNGRAGVAISALGTHDGVGNSVLHNSIYANSGLGIDLGTSGVTPNDPGDGDSGPNNLQNAPVISSASPTTATLALSGPANSTFNIDIFSVAAPDPSGYGEGQVFLGTATVTTDSSGNVSQTVAVPTSTSPGSYLSATATDAGGNTGEFSNAMIVSVSGGIAARYAFYNNSSFDHYTPGRDDADSLAIAAGKVPLLPGGHSGFANYTSYTKGINGLILDLTALPSNVTLAASDFVFQTGTSSAVNPAQWSLTPTPPDVFVTRGSGIYASDRVTLIWSDAAAVKNAWLRVTLKGGSRTGLAADDVFYFGNAVGETGDQPGDAMVTSADYYGTRDHLRGYASPAPVDFKWDFNRDGVVDVNDMLVVRASATSNQTALQLITAPASAPAQVNSRAAVAPPKSPARSTSLSLPRSILTTTTNVLQPALLSSTSIIRSATISVDTTSRSRPMLIPIRRTPSGW